MVPVGCYLVDVADVHCREVDVFLQRGIGCLDAAKITRFKIVKNIGLFKITQNFWAVLKNHYKILHEKPVKTQSHVLPSK